jgi:hypothetical protein
MDGYFTEEDDDLADECIVGVVRMDEHDRLSIEYRQAEDTVENALWVRSLNVLMSLDTVHLRELFTSGDMRKRVMALLDDRHIGDVLHGYGLWYDVHHEIHLDPVTMQYNGRVCFSMWVRNNVKQSRRHMPLYSVPFVCQCESSDPQ